MCYGTVPADLLVKIVDPSRQSDRFVRPVVSPSENSRSGSELPKRTSSTTLGNKFLSVSQISNENTCTDVWVNCSCCATKSNLETIFCMCGRKLGGLPDVQEANARVVIEAGSRATRALTQLQIREQVLRAPRVGQTQESQH